MSILNADRRHTSCIRPTAGCGRGPREAAHPSGVRTAPPSERGIARSSQSITAGNRSDGDSSSASQASRRTERSPSPGRSSSTRAAAASNTSSATRAARSRRPRDEIQVGQHVAGEHGRLRFERHELRRRATSGDRGRRSRRPSRARRRAASSRSRAGESLLHVDLRFERGRPEVGVDQARRLLVEAQPEQQVVAGDGVRLRDRPRSTDRRDARGRHRCMRSGRGARGASWSRCSSACRRASASRSASDGSIGQAGRPGARSTRGPARGPASVARVAEPTPPVSPTNGMPLALDRVEAHPQRGRLLRRRPRGRRRPPRRASSAARGRWPSACRPAATRGGSGPCCPTRSASRSSESWSQICSAPSDGSAVRRSPSAIELPRPADELVAGHAGAARG